MLLNPYTPGAGVPPRYLAGREATMAAANESLEYISHGYFARSVVYYGLRGVGKTVLLNQIENMAEEKNIHYEQIEVSERGSFKSTVSLHVLKLIRKMSVKETVKQYTNKAFAVLKAFSVKYSTDGNELSIGIESEIAAAVGVADTGNFQNDLTELLVALGTIAQKAECGAILFIDEIQYLQDEEFEALIAAVHRVNQKALPLTIFAAGLPKIAKIAGDVKSYAERLFQFIEIGSLSKEAGKLALIEPAKKWQVEYEAAAVELVLEITECYPYFLQEYGKQVWNQLKEERIITKQMVECAYSDFEKSLDESFFKVRHDRATPRELDFMIAMVKTGKLPCTTKAIAEEMNCQLSTVSPLRAQLMHKGFIYSSTWGTVDFTVPQFDRFLKRIHEI